MSQSPLFIVVDDTRSDSFVFGPQPWTKTTFPEWFNGSSQTARFSAGGLGTVQFKFQGTSASVFGLTPSAADAQNFMVSIDGSKPVPATYADPNPPSYRQWYQSPLLSDGTHNLFLSQISGASIDFATVTVGQNTPLANQLVIADNDDPGFAFNGKWKRSQAQFNSGPRPDGNPYHNSTHQTSYVGDSFTYRFTGGSLAIYGIFTWSNLGLLTLSFDIDGQALSDTFPVTSDTPQFKSELGQQQNFLFKSFDFLTPGSHTLVVNLTDCVNQTFAFDYLTYSPSFASLASMPDLTQHSTTTNEQRSSDKSKLVGPLVGAGAGVILLLLLGGLIFVFRRRRRGKGLYKPLSSQRNSILPIPRRAAPDRQTTIASFFAGSESMDMHQRETGVPYSDNNDLSYVTSPVHSSPQAAPQTIPQPVSQSATQPLPPLQPVRRAPNTPQYTPTIGIGIFRNDTNTRIGVGARPSMPPSYDETTSRR